ncbi:MAG: hypothetical protein QOD51_1120 [Candidatus Eremiobacteraeota bacterium]|jgi:hypothetical protein|nr:hypothetical protein [Candidatus Eremiobacteraeota bacterium]
MTTSIASPADNLGAFIRTAKERGVPDDALVPLLRQNGWSERRVYASLTEYYGETLGVAPPSRSGRGEYAYEAFLYLLNFITLGLWAVALGQIFCTIIARWLPDPARPLGAASLVHEVAWQLATIIVAFPCFLLVGRLIARELSRRPDAFDSGVRAWLTYVALVITGMIALGDGIWFVSEFLRGALTAQFVLDTLVVVGLSGGIFNFYARTLRPPEAAP